MDSPFGALDENYRKEVAHVIPSLAPQVVLFVSRAQGAGVVRSELEARIGEQYVISYHTPKGEAEEEFFEIAGSRWPYIERSQNSFEWATINGMKTGKPQ
jgi:DNA sulfur modification protein DndD